MVVAIAGVHRAGTSMVARCLNLCGLDLGPAHEIVAPAPDNPEGFWENVSFVVINDMILEVLGGTWDAPPPFVPRWETRAELADLTLAGRELVERFSASGTAWAWKDPRNCLTLPFWLRLVPEARVVVCLRNPLEVARSLERRDGSSLDVGFELWLAYHRRLCADVPRARRVVTHYASYFPDGSAELARVLAHLGLAPRPAAMRRALGAVRRHLRHHEATLAALVRARPAPAVVALYRRLCAEARRPAPRAQGRPAQGRSAGGPLAAAPA